MMMYPYLFHSFVLSMILMTLAVIFKVIDIGYNEFSSDLG